MKELKQADLFHLNASQGWLGLGDFISANDELEEIAPEFRVHPAVLMRCEIYSAAREWGFVIAITDTLVQQFPKLAEPWIHRSFALHELKRTREAYDSLLSAAKKFPKLQVIPYNLSSYACQPGKLDEAMKRLGQAIGLSLKTQDIRLQALEDPDVEPLWNKIGEI